MGLAVDPLPRRQVGFGIECLPEKACDLASRGLDRFVQDPIARHSQDLFRRRIKPAHDTFFIGRDDAGWNRLQQGLGQCFLHSRFFVKKRVFQHGRNVLGQDHQALEILVIKPLSGEPMAKKQPPNDAPASIKRNDHFRAKIVECPPQSRTLIPVGGVGQIGPADQMGMQFKPAHQRIALPELDLMRLRQTPQTRS